MKTQFNFSESACIITGAANGNGLAIAKAFINSGCITYTIDITPLKENINSIHFIGDICDSKILDLVFSRIKIKGIKSLFLINNAGISIVDNIDIMDKWNKTLGINLTAAFSWSMKFFDFIKTYQISEAAIINIGSLATMMGFPDNPAYQVSKAGILGLTRALAYDFANYKIRVNCISPGYIHTNMTKLSFNDNVKYNQRLRQTLLKRWGEPEDICGPVLFLCSDFASYITGINLPVDGGWSINGLVVD
jgi:NAD(P)-dependent dehydrogenase (short-subunit alcohol dehydrogenase family)